MKKEEDAFPGMGRGALSLRRPCTRRNSNLLTQPAHAWQHRGEHLQAGVLAEIPGCLRLEAG